MPRILFVALLALLSFRAEASSITLKFHSQLSQKEFSIEKGLESLTGGTLDSNRHTIDISTLLTENATRVPARLAISGHKEFMLGINLYLCRPDCKWQVVITELPTTRSENVDAICKQPGETIEDLYKRYFFCRLAYMGHLAAGFTCWPTAKQALSGWFDAAYQLHIQTLREGSAFVARDTVAEAYVRDAQSACDGFEGSVRKAGYFGGMVRELDRAMLQTTRLVERLLNNAQYDEAKRWAETMVQEIGSSRSIRDSIPNAEISYVEAILNRALLVEPRYTLP
jgi:hypothetical protein